MTKLHQIFLLGFILLCSSGCNLTNETQATYYPDNLEVIIDGRSWAANSLRYENYLGTQQVIGSTTTMDSEGFVRQIYTVNIGTRATKSGEYTFEIPAKNTHFITYTIEDRSTSPARIRTFGSTSGKLILTEVANNRLRGEFEGEVKEINNLGQVIGSLGIRLSAGKFNKNR